MNKSKVAVIKCDSLDEKIVKSAVQRGIELLGGFKTLFQKGEKVLLKPNLLVPAEPEKAITTHPVVFQAIAELCIEAGLKVTWGDSPALGFTSRAAKKAGLFSVAEKLKIKQADFANSVDVPFDEGKAFKRFQIAAGVHESDAVISLSKMKPHGLMKITGAIKNQYGCLPGLQKGQHHLRLAARNDFASMLVDLTRLIKPRLYIMDGIIAMEREGPRSGTPTRMNLLLFSTDPVALDTIFCDLINLNPEYVPTNVIGERFGLGNMNKSNIEIVGDDPNELRRDNFIIDRKPVRELTTSGAAKFFRNILIDKPRPYHKNCIKCGDCEKICPTNPKSVKLVQYGKGKRIKFSYKTCIRCYCCAEVCPAKAIYLGKVRKIFGIRRN
ncbi:MAG: DUF362 domain-containing protein [Acidobacteria bacterium]|nr:DUF362 domain-containing protein [Acidobacteriota bacterium]